MGLSRKMLPAAFIAVFLLGAAASAVAQSIPPVGPSGPTGWCTDKDGKNYRC